MPPRIRRLSRRVHRLLTVALLLLIATPVTIGWLEWSRQHREDLASAVRSAGGLVTLPPPLLENLRDFAETREWDSDTLVWLYGSNIDDRWLCAHDYLQGLDITSFISSEKIGADVVTRLIDEHPIRRLSLPQQRNADIVAVALSRGRRIADVGLNDSDLTDTGFQKLPLEQLEFLWISDTQLTSRGLQALSRSQRLILIALDGRLIDSDVVGVLSKLTALRELTLTGPDVTDEKVRLLRPLANLSHIHLRNTDLTRSGFDRLERLLPNCRVSVQPPFDDNQ